jgi:hypothetical protein
MLEGAAVRERGSTIFHGHVDADILVRPAAPSRFPAS